MSDPTTAPAVEHLPDERRFVVRLPTGEATLVYVRDDRSVDFLHTEVPPEARGQGVADALAEHAVRWARSEGLEVVATCPFVRGWLKRREGGGR